MNKASSTSRYDLRREYWEQKHLQPDWAQDIHFALFSEKWVDAQEFHRGIDTNTNKVLQDIIERASLYGLSKELRVLDFGCGAADLLIKLVSEIDTARGTGIDIAHTAVDAARNRAIPPGLVDRLTLIVGGIEQLQELAVSEESSFDVLICRDAYYLLYECEQSQLLSCARQLLRQGGLFYVADFCVLEDCLEKVNELITERQFGGKPITWNRDKHGDRVFSLLSQAEGEELEIVRSFPDISEWAVRDSYRAASGMAQSVAIKRTFEELATLCEPQHGDKKSPIPYGRFFFQSRSSNNVVTEDKHVGVVLNKAYKPDGKRELLLPGEWLLPEHKWSLVLGRSGAGKTTLLNMISSAIVIKATEGRVIKDAAASLFYLSQHPALIQELRVHDNIALFAKSLAALSKVSTSLGLEGEIAERKADDHLSGGERQRTALGQAIAAEPDILLLDEPCAGVDRVRKKNFFSSLHKSLCRNKATENQPTIICVDHEFLMIEEYFDYIFEISNGRFVCVKGRP